MEKILVNKDEHEIEPRPLNFILHKEMMNIKCPERFEINPVLTLEEVRGLNQEKWEHLSTGEIFQFLFRKVFPLPDATNHSAPNTEIKIPTLHAELLECELGVQHIAGLIILAMTQGGILGKKLYFRFPEAYLHPAYECNLGDLFIVMGGVIEYMQNWTEPPPNPVLGWLE